MAECIVALGDAEEGWRRVKRVMFRISLLSEPTCMRPIVVGESWLRMIILWIFVQRGCDSVYDACLRVATM